MFFLFTRAEISLENPAERAHPALPVPAPVEQGDVVEVRRLRLGLPRLDEPPDVAVHPRGGRVLHRGGREGRPAPQLLRRRPQGPPLSGGVRDRTTQSSTRLGTQTWGLLGTRAVSQLERFGKEEENVPLLLV